MKTTLKHLLLAIVSTYPLLALAEVAGFAVPSFINLPSLLSLYVLVGFSLLIEKDYGKTRKTLVVGKGSGLPKSYCELAKRAAKHKSSPYRLAA